MSSIYDDLSVGNQPQGRLVRIAQRLKHERNQARVERDEALMQWEEARRERDRPVSNPTSLAAIRP